MQKLLLLSLAIFLTSIDAGAQTLTISGTVKTQDGDALRFAFVQDITSKTGVYADSTGYFSLAVPPNSMLLIKCFGFRDTIISVNGQTALNIILRPNVNIQARRGPEPTNTDPVNLATLRDMIMNDLASQSFEVARQNMHWPQEEGAMTAHQPANVSTVDMAQGAIFPSFTHKEATQGSRYFFDTWVHGYVINDKDSLVQNPGFLFNYDKISGNLLLSQDRHAAIELYKTSVRSFTLFDASNLAYAFALVPGIDKNHYVQVISSGSNYAIFKLITTKFKTADYTTDGVASTGNDYDSYENEETYYVLNATSGQLQRLTPKKKALKVIFADRAEKLNKFMTENSEDIDDAYLANLCQYLNK